MLRAQYRSIQIPSNVRWKRLNPFTFIIRCSLKPLLRGIQIIHIHPPLEVSYFYLITKSSYVKNQNDQKMLSKAFYSFYGPVFCGSKGSDLSFSSNSYSFSNLGYSYSLPPAFSPITFEPLSNYFLADNPSCSYNFKVLE